MVGYTYYVTDARVRREAETLAANPSYEVEVLVLKEASSPRTYLLDNVVVHELNLAKYRGQSGARYMISYLMFLFLAFAECIRLLAANRLDVVHVHNMPNFLVLCALVPVLLGKKIILDVHDTVLETYASKFTEIRNETMRRVLTKLLYLEETMSFALADRVIAVNQIQRDTLVKRGLPAWKTLISMNVPDPKRFYKGTSAADCADNGRFRLVYFGTITRRLGIDVAIEAVAELAGEIPAIEFHIIGDGEDMEAFKRLSESLKIEDIVHFSGRYYPLEELVPLLQNMDLCIVPNRRSPATELMLPVKMLESVALGIPVLTPKLETIEHYFGDDMVFYFEADSVSSLASALRQAHEHPDLRARKARRAKSFLDKYGWETHQYALIDAYKALLS
jgi:glycosyltransferase involved in cell wall biosynthesis